MSRGDRHCVTRGLAGAAAVAAAMLVSASLCAAQGSPAAGITVSGSGEAQGNPAVARINVWISGGAQIGSDAAVKFHEVRRRVTEALEGLKLENMTIQGDGVGVNTAPDTAQVQAAMRGQPMAGAPQVVVSEKLAISLSGIDKMDDQDLVRVLLRLTDTVQDAGGSLMPDTPNLNQVRSMQSLSVVSFQVDNADALREQAYQAAMEDAQRRARRLAHLAGVKLGTVQAIEEAPAGGGQAAQNARMYMPYVNPWLAMAMGEPRTDAFRKVPVRVELAVRFAIVE